MFYFFPIDFVYSNKIKNHRNIKDKILNQIQSRVDDEKGCVSIDHVFQSYYNGNKYNSFLFDEEILNNIVWQPLEQMLSELKEKFDFPWLRPESSVILNCWYNRYDKDDYIGLHDHLANSRDGYTPSFSFVYIVDTDGQKNTTVFRKRSPLTCGPVFGQHLYDTREEKSIGEGSVVIFPCHLEHFVLPESGKKITCQFNIGTKY